MMNDDDDDDDDDDDEDEDDEDDDDDVDMHHSGVPFETQIWTAQHLRGQFLSELLVIFPLVNPPEIGICPVGCDPSYLGVVGAGQSNNNSEELIRPHNPLCLVPPDPTKGLSISLRTNHINDTRCFTGFCGNQQHR